jgi:Zn-dependent metalloprotease
MVISGSRYTLAYKISITTTSPFGTIVYHVDANTGAILKFQTTCINDGPANIIGYGSRIIDSRWKGGFTQAYILETNDASRVIHTKKNPNGTTAWSVLNNTTDNDDNWGTSYDTETTTHYHVSNSWDYYRNTFGRTGQNNQSREIRVRTQWNQTNADFTPEGGSNNRLRFGTTSVGRYYGSEPSVVAHEYTHGVTHHTSNLTYTYESGALNESFSDIFGTVIQAVMMDGGNTDWLYGNFVSSSNEEIRSLQTPNNFGSHIDGSGNLALGQPDTYNGTFWYSGTGDYGGVHINSGVMNKWFFLLSMGEQGTNDLADFYDIDGIGMTRAARIAYLAQTSILQSSSQYTDARQATISAAIMLFGECSVEHQQTVDAWFAVGIGNLNNCDFNLSIPNLQERDLVIYPNPTSSDLNIELPMLTTDKVQIFDMTGKLVQEFKTESLISKTDISTLQNGIYNIRFSFNGESINKRFIVQK